MHHECHNFNGVHVYLQSNRISLHDSYHSLLVINIDSKLNKNLKDRDKLDIRSTKCNTKVDDKVPPISSNIELRINFIKSIKT